jgi:hypothetical protein
MDYDDRGQVDAAMARSELACSVPRECQDVPECALMSQPRRPLRAPTAGRRDLQDPFA